MVKHEKEKDQSSRGLKKTGVAQNNPAASHKHNTKYLASVS